MAARHVLRVSLQLAVTLFDNIVRIYISILKVSKAVCPFLTSWKNVAVKILQTFLGILFEEFDEAFALKAEIPPDLALSEEPEMLKKFVCTVLYFLVP